MRGVFDHGCATSAYPTGFSIHFFKRLNMFDSYSQTGEDHSVGIRLVVLISMLALNSAPTPNSIEMCTAGASATNRLRDVEQPEILAKQVV